MAVNSFNAQNPPLTTKGDLFTFSTVPTRLAVGATNGHVLQVDSTTATGLKWAAAGADMVKLNTTTFSASTAVTIDSVFSSTYEFYIVTGYAYGTANGNINCQFRSGGSSQSGNYSQALTQNNNSGTNPTAGQQGSGLTSAYFGRLNADTSAGTAFYHIFINPSGSKRKNVMSQIASVDDGWWLTGGFGRYNTASYDGITLTPSSGNMTGSITIYGMKV